MAEKGGKNGNHSGDQKGRLVSRIPGTLQSSGYAVGTQKLQHRVFQPYIPYILLAWYYTAAADSKKPICFTPTPYKHLHHPPFSSN